MCHFATQEMLAVVAIRVDALAIESLLPLPGNLTGSMANIGCPAPVGRSLDRRIINDGILTVSTIHTQRIARPDDFGRFVLTGGIYCATVGATEVQSAIWPKIYLTP